MMQKEKRFSAPEVEDDKDKDKEDEDKKEDNEEDEERMLRRAIAMSLEEQ